MADLVTRLLLDTKNFDNNVKSAGKDVDSFTSRMAKGNVSVQEFSSKISGVAVSSVAKFAGGLGLAAGASEAFEKTIKSTQSTGDALANSIYAATTSVDAFFRGLNTGDFSVFNDGILSAYEKLFNLSALIDELADKRLSFGFIEAKELSEIEKYTQEAKDSERSMENRKLSAEKAAMSVDHLKKKTLELLDTEAKVLKVNYKAKYGIDISMSDLELFAGYTNFGDKSTNKAVEEYKTGLEKIKKQFTVSQYGLGGSVTGTGLTTEGKAAVKAYEQENEKIRNQVVLLEEVDSERKTMIDTLTMYFNRLEKISSLEKKTDRTTRGILKEEDRLDKISEKEKITVPIKIGSEKDLTMQIAKIKEKIEAEANPDIRFDLLKQQNNLQTQLDQIIKNNKRVIDLALNIKPLKSDVLKGTTGKRVIDDIEKYRKELNAFSESNQNSAIKGSVEDIQKRIQEVTLAYNRATTDGLRALYAQQREDLEEHLQNMTDINSQMIDISNEMNSLVKSGVTSAFESIGDIIGSDDSSEAFKNSLMGMMDMLKQFGASLVAAGMAKMAFDKLFTNPYLAIAAGGALIIAATAAKSALGNTKGYANGGIIPGNSVSGDRVLARVNSGEMILNQMQQGNLFNMLNNPSSSGSDTQTPEVVFHIKGNDLIGVLNNMNKKTSRTK